jgi:hypothetical protein
MISLLQAIDPNLDADFITNHAIVPAALELRGGGRCATTMAVLQNLLISRNIRAFIEDGTCSGSVPRSLYIRNKQENTNVLEIHVRDDLRRRIQLFEGIAWEKTQIQSVLLDSVEESLNKAGIVTTPPSIRIIDMQAERSSFAAGNRRTLFSVPCSDSKILLAFDDKTSFDRVIVANPTLRLCALGPLEELTLSYGRWGSARANDAEGERRTAQKDATARQKAQTTTPPMSAITRLSVRLTVDIAPGAARQALLPTENALVECLGGQARGIIDVQLFSDACGRIPLTYANIWVGDRDEDDRRCCETLERNLKDGTAAIRTHRFCKISSRGIAAKTLLRGTEPTELTTEAVAGVIANAIGELSAGGFMVPRTTQGGLELPTSDDGNEQHEIDMAQLGPSLQTDGLYAELRTLFVGARQHPTVRQLGAALRILSNEGVLSLYGNVLNGREIFVIHAAYRDAWYVQDDAGSA